MQDKTSDINNIINDTFAHIKEIVDANLVVGKSIKINENNIIVPISKISLGLVSGGGNLNKKQKNKTAGTMSGFNIIPYGFVTFCNDSVNFMAVNNDNMTQNAIDGFFKIYEIIVSKLNKNGENNEE